MQNLKERFRAWILYHAHQPHAPWVLAIMAFLESVILPIPPDLALIPLVAIRPKKWLTYVGITTAASVLGGIFGYIIGAALFQSVGLWLIDTYNVVDQFAQVQATFDKNAFTALFISGFTPIPYKVFTITAGVFRTNIFVFFVASILGRGMRFLLEGYLMHRYGTVVARTIYKYLNIAMLVAIAVVVVAIVIF